MTDTNETPDYMVDFDRFWRPLVTDKYGALDVEKIARELGDYRVVMNEVSTVYDELTNGRFSKPNTASGYIIERAHEVETEDFADMLCEAIADEDDEDLTRDKVIAIAESWSDGAWDRYSELREMRRNAEGGGS
jgi:hypothetical protein